MSDMEIDDITVDQARQLTERQLSSLTSLWRLSHYKQAPWSSWSILYSRPRFRRSRSPMLVFDTDTYQILKEHQEQELKRKQIHQHHIWQHVQDRLAEQNRILEEEKAQAAETSSLSSSSGEKSKNQKKGQEAGARGKQETVAVSTTMNLDEGDLPSLSPTSSSSTVTSGSGSPETTSAPLKRSIRWGLQNNMVKKFDKTSPITLVTVPAVDKLPSKSALKIRTAHTIQRKTTAVNRSGKPMATSTTTATTTTTTATTTAITPKNNTSNKREPPARKRAVDFF
ncbi:hypothetical protein EDD11_007685 [Mortierella claussenii]|nr:hypothetical protein EDD11_007685 [Mortierella claussenii]